MTPYKKFKPRKQTVEHVLLALNRLFVVPRRWVKYELAAHRGKKDILYNLGQADDALANCWCLSGGIQLLTPLNSQLDSPLRRAVMTRLHNTILRDTPHRSIAGFNDHPTVRIKTIHKVIKTAIRDVRRELALDPQLG